MCKIMCFIGLHKFKDTNCISFTQVSRKRRRKNIIQKCTRCCTTRKGAEYIGKTYKGGNTCKII